MCCAAQGQQQGPQVTSLLSARTAVGDSQVHVRRFRYVKQWVWSEGFCVCSRGKEKQPNAGAVFLCLMCNLTWGDGRGILP